MTNPGTVIAGLRAGWVPTAAVIFLAAFAGFLFTSSARIPGDNLGSFGAVTGIAAIQALLSFFMLISSAWPQATIHLLNSIFLICLVVKVQKRELVRFALYLQMVLVLMDFGITGFFSSTLPDIATQCSDYYPFMNSHKLCAANGYVGFLFFVGVIIAYLQPLLVAAVYIPYASSDSSSYGAPAAATPQANMPPAAASAPSAPAAAAPVPGKDATAGEGYQAAGW